ncbi:MAG: hypothetical protein WDO13_07955 [Verrucomicrobiota bacterium]
MQPEFYFPKFYAGAPFDYHLNSINNLKFFSIGGTKASFTQVNFNDSPTSDNSSPPNLSAGCLGPPDGTFPYWANNLLQILDQNGNPAGVDLCGWPAATTGGAAYADPDQTNAQLYHPYCLSPNPSPPIYQGSDGVDIGPGAFSLLSFLNLSTNQYWGPGIYHSLANFYGARSRSARPDATGFQITGGFDFPDN